MDISRRAFPGIFQSRIFQPLQELFSATVWFFFIFNFSYSWRPFHTRIVSKSVIQTSCYCVQQLFITFTPGVDCSFYITTSCPVIINKSTLVVKIPKMESNIIPKFLLYERLDCCRFYRVSRKIKIM